MRFEYKICLNIIVNKIKISRNNEFELDKPTILLFK